jgi:predicted DNA-binding transcriptional regulator YafY
MERVERFYKIDQMLRGRRFVTRATFLEELDVAPATFKRDLDYMRSRLFAPIVYGRDPDGYRLDLTQNESSRYQLPGLWFNDREAQALLVLESLLDQIQPGVLADHTTPLRPRLEKLLDKSIEDREQLRRRIRILTMGSRVVPTPSFSILAHAVLKRKRVHFNYGVRSRGELTKRTVSPQRLVHYRDNWYLDAWCHLRNGLRSFAVDAVEKPQLLDTRAKDVSDQALDRELAGSYGIYSGEPDKVAVLRFSALRSRWVCKETWHPKQELSYEADQRLVLKLPYHHHDELVMDILKYGPDVEVLEPSELRSEVANKAREIIALYR